MTSQHWDDRYAAADRVWSAEPNLWVVQHTAGIEPGTALDVACGEGRNAIWLAGRGWRVLGIDFSAVAVDRARRLAQDAGRDARFEVADVTDLSLNQTFNLVLVCYLQVPEPARRAALRAAAAHTALGGHLLIIAHHRQNLTDGTGGPQDPAALYDEEAVAADLAGTGLEVLVADAPQRTVPDAARDAIDLVVLARREDVTSTAGEIIRR